jgi:hypothetical protein
MVGYPDRTAFFGDYFRVGGDPPATREGVQNDLQKCLDEWVGDFGTCRGNNFIKPISSVERVDH